MSLGEVDYGLMGVVGGGENGKIYGKEMNAARQSCECFLSMGADLVEIKKWRCLSEYSITSPVLSKN